jgi:hypothetical protein
MAALYASAFCEVSRAWDAELRRKGQATSPKVATFSQGDSVVHL